MLPPAIYTGLANILEIKIEELLSRKKNPEVSLQAEENGNAWYFNETGDVTINVVALTKEQQEGIAQTIRQEIAEGRPVLAQSVKNQTKKIEKALPTNSDEKLLEFYKGKVSLRVEKCLEAAITLRNLRRKGEDIAGMKMDIGRRFPEIGINICNLVSGGYFETDFKSIYENMSGQEGFKEQDYQSFIEDVVVEAPFTVFIDSRSPDSTKIVELKKKLQNLKSYGLAKLFVHALGHENVEKGMRVIEKIKEDDNFREQIARAKIEKNYLTLKVTFLLR